MKIDNYPSDSLKIGKIRNISSQIQAGNRASYNIYKLLDGIRPFSHLYVESNGVLGLSTLIAVYETAMHDAGVSDTSKPAFSEFSAFVRAELDYSNQSVDWSLVILSIVMGSLKDDVSLDDSFGAVSDEYSRETIDEFYRLLDLYRGTHERSSN